MISYISIAIGYAQHDVNNKTFHVILHDVQFLTFLLVKFHFYLKKNQEQEAKFSL